MRKIRLRVCCFETLTALIQNRELENDSWFKDGHIYELRTEQLEEEFMRAINYGPVTMTTMLAMETTSKRVVTKLTQKLTRARHGRRQRIITLRYIYKFSTNFTQSRQKSPSSFLLMGTEERSIRRKTS